jgi:hypothetical protein
MPTRNPRVLERDRALARLSRLTTMTALAGVVGTVGFGGLAALNYRGTTTSATSTSEPTTDSITDPSGSATTANDPSAHATTPPTRTSVQLQPAQPPTRSTHRARVSTGGSG